MKVGLFIPTLNAGDFFNQVLGAIAIQDYDFEIRKIIIDSGSTDNTIEIAKNYNFEIYNIQKEEFNHGGTRNLAVNLLDDCEIIIMMTQDVLLANKESFEKIVNFFNKDEEIFMAYGRQIADALNSSWFEREARSYNYPDKDIIKSLSNIDDLGIKTVFASNAFSAYKTVLFKRIGGFDQNINFSEDMHIAAKGISDNLKVAYVSSATAFHTHNYRVHEEFKRYLEIGKFHKTHSWIQERFGKNENEGYKLVINEIRKILSEKKYNLIVMSLMINMAKYLGYKIGKFV